jgi:N-acetylglucosaminyldiphosphoundecaprenol N-acetyl-beta-D-mannosaminyltransferase
MDAVSQNDTAKASLARFTRPDWVRNKRVLLLGAPLDALSMSETLGLIADAMRERTALQHVVVNVAKLVFMQEDAALYKDVASSDLINIDGAGVVLGCKLMGVDVPGRVAGIDVMDGVLALCEREGYKPYILGAKTDILAQAKANIDATYSGIQWAGMQDGYYDRGTEREVMQSIADSGADCLFIAMPSPHKERIMGDYKDVLHIPFMMGVGGSVDVFAGFVSRAPVWMQKAGMEWVYRLLQEPKRMFKRYWVTNRKFAVLLLKAKLGQYKAPDFAQKESTS